MKLLIITSAYVPDKFASAICVSNIVNAFLWNEKNKIDILTIAHNKSYPTNKESDIDIYRIFNKFVLITENICDEKKGKKIIGKVCNKLIEIYIWPSCRIGAKKELLCKARELVTGSYYDAIVTISGDFVSQMIGISLKKDNMVDRWFSIMLDPFPSNHPWFNWWIRAIWRLEKKERFLLENADICFCEEHILPEVYMTRKNKRRCTLVPVGIPNLKSYESLDVKKKTEKDGYILLFAGVWKNDVRNPDKCIEILNLVAERINIKLVVYTDREFTSTEVITFRKYIPHDELVFEMLKADVLLNIGNDIGLFPSKLVDYASTGKPILNFVTSDRDISIAFMNDYQNGIVIYQDECIQEQVVEVVDFIMHSNKRLKHDDIEARLHKYSPFFITEEIKKAIINGEKM